MQPFPYSNPTASSYVVRVGQHNSNQQEASAKNYNVKRLIIHPDYNEQTYDNDIALVEVSSDIIWSTFVIPVCLPAIGNDPAHGLQVQLAIVGSNRLSQKWIYTLAILPVNLNSQSNIWLLFVLFTEWILFNWSRFLSVFSRVYSSDFIYRKVYMPYQWNYEFEIWKIWKNQNLKNLRKIWKIWKFKFEKFKIQNWKI